MHDCEHKFSPATFECVNCGVDMMAEDGGVLITSSAGQHTHNLSKCTLEEMTEAYLEATPNRQPLFTVRPHGLSNLKPCGCPARTICGCSGHLEATAAEMQKRNDEFVREFFRTNRLEPLRTKGVVPVDAEYVNTLLAATIDPLLRRIEALEARMPKTVTVEVSGEWHTPAEPKPVDIAQTIRDVSAGR